MSTEDARRAEKRGSRHLEGRGKTQGTPWREKEQEGVGKRKMSICWSLCPRHSTSHYRTKGEEFDQQDS